MRKPKKTEQPKPIRIDAVRWKKIVARAREAMARQEQRLIQHQKLESERLKFNHPLSGGGFHNAPVFHLKTWQLGGNGHQQC